MHCTHCGTALPDKARFCPECGLKATAGGKTHHLQHAPGPPPQSPATVGRRYFHFEDVPFYRRSVVMHLVVLAGFWCPPLVIIACIIALTGEIYRDSKDQHGNLRVWGVGNKIAAFILLVLYVGAIVFLISLFQN